MAYEFALVTRITLTWNVFSGLQGHVTSHLWSLQGAAPQL